MLCYGSETQENVLLELFQKPNEMLDKKNEQMLTSKAHICLYPPIVLLCVVIFFCLYLLKKKKITYKEEFSMCFW